MWAFTDQHTSLFNVGNKAFKAIKNSQKDFISLIMLRSKVNL